MSASSARVHNPAYDAGVKLAAEGRHAEALDQFEAALKREPDGPHILFALGNTARDTGDRDTAEAFYRRVLAGEPDRLEALINLANLLREGGRAADALALLKPATQKAPEHAELWLTLGSACRELGDAKHAEIFYREALRLRPGYTPALGNLADMAADDGKFAEAIALYDTVLKCERQNAQARLNRAILHLVSGELKAGWRDYEYRLRLAKAVRYEHGLRRWNGKAWRDGATLLITAEQGIGDQILFASLLPDVEACAAKARGGVILEAEPRLVPLFARSFAGTRVFPCTMELRAGVTSAQYDWLHAAGGAEMAIALASLPRHLRRSLEDFPQRTQYLVPDAEEAARWRGWLAAQAEGPFFGLCWRSGKSGGLRALQYAPFESWARFAKDLPGQIVCAQYDAAPEEIAQLAALSGRTILVPPHLDQKQEIDRTAAMLSALTAVVSAPTAVACLSAAVGVPTYKILYNTSWTALGQDYEPFAPACRCVMPNAKGDWADCFAQVLKWVSSE